MADIIDFEKYRSSRPDPDERLPVLTYDDFKRNAPQAAPALNGEFDIAITYTIYRATIDGREPKTITEMNKAIMEYCGAEVFARCMEEIADSEQA